MILIKYNKFSDILKLYPIQLERIYFYYFLFHLNIIIDLYFLDYIIFIFSILYI